MTYSDVLADLGLEPQSLRDGDLTVRTPIDGSEIASVTSDDARTTAAKIERAPQAFLSWRDIPAPRFACSVTNCEPTRMPSAAW